MTKYDVILFDLDGTLTDSQAGIKNSIRYALSKFNISGNDLNNFHQFIGPPLEESFRKYYSFDKPKAQQAVKYYREYFSETGIYENRLYPGIPDLLIQLQRMKKKLAIATMKPTLFTRRILKHFELFDYFSLIIGSNLDGTPSSKTEIVHLILSGLADTPRRKMAMVGDRDQDIIAAHDNVIDSIAVTYGYGSMKELQASRPAYIVNSVEELGRLLLD